MTKRVKKKAHEKLTDSHIKHVVGLLEGSPPITKKEACEILNISYNTTRLTKIIEEWKSDLEYRQRKIAEKKGKPASNAEIASIVEFYLDGNNISDIAKRLYRSSAFVKSIINRVGVPQRASGEQKFKTAILPDSCIADSFEIGEIVWSAKYHAPCEIKDKLPEKYKKMYGGECYLIWVKEGVETVSEYLGFVQGTGFNAYAPFYDLGSLKHLKQYGVNIDKI